MNKSTIFGLFVIAATISVIVVTIHAEDMHSFTVNSDRVLSTEAQEIQNIEQMPCDEFWERNANGVDYRSSEIRDAAKAKKTVC